MVGDVDYERKDDEGEEIISDVQKARDEAMKSIGRLGAKADKFEAGEPSWHLKDEGSAPKDDKYKFQNIEKQKECEDGKTRYKIVFEYATNITGNENYNYYTGKETQSSEVVGDKIKVGNLVRYIGDGEEKDKVAIVSKIIHGTDTNEGASRYYEKAISSGVSMNLDDVKKLNKKTIYTLKFLHGGVDNYKPFVTAKSKLKKERFYNKNRCFRAELEEGEDKKLSDINNEIKAWIEEEMQKLFGVNSKNKKYFSPEFIYKGKIVRHNKKDDTYKIELTDGSHPFCKLDNIPKKAIRLVEKDKKNEKKRDDKLEKKREEGEIIDERVKEEYLDKGDIIKINTGNPQPNVRYYTIRSSYKGINIIKESGDIILIKIKIFLDLGRETIRKEDDSKMKMWWNKITDTTANGPATMNCKKRKNVVAEIVSSWFGYGGGKNRVTLKIREKRKKTRKKRRRGKKTKRKKLKKRNKGSHKKRRRTRGN